MGKYDFLNGVFPSRECGICGKKFVINKDWAYKINKPGKNGIYSYIYYCSYTCYRKAGGDNGRFYNHIITGKHKRKKRLL